MSFWDQVDPTWLLGAAQGLAQGAADPYSNPWLTATQGGAQAIQAEQQRQLQQQQYDLERERQLLGVELQRERILDIQDARAARAAALEHETALRGDQESSLRQEIEQRRSILPRLPKSMRLEAELRINQPDFWRWLDSSRRAAAPQKPVFNQRTGQFYDWQNGRVLDPFGVSSTKAGPNGAARPALRPEDLNNLSQQFQALVAKAPEAIRKTILQRTATALESHSTAGEMAEYLTVAIGELQGLVGG